MQSDNAVNFQVFFRNSIKKQMEFVVFNGVTPKKAQSRMYQRVIFMRLI